MPVPTTPPPHGMTAPPAGTMAATTTTTTVVVGGALLAAAGEEEEAGVSTPCTVPLLAPMCVVPLRPRPRPRLPWPLLLPPSFLRPYDLSRHLSSFITIWHRPSLLFPQSTMLALPLLQKLLGLCLLSPLPCLLHLLTLTTTLNLNPTPSPSLMLILNNIVPTCSNRLSSTSARITYAQMFS